MAQFVVYGHAGALRPRIRSLSDAIHEALHELDPRHTPAPATPKEERA